MRLKLSVSDESPAESSAATTQANLESVYQSALVDFRSGRLTRAAGKFRQLVSDGSEDPRHLSYCGLFVALIERDYRQAITYCQRATQSAIVPEPELYLNLAKVLEIAGQRRKAVQSLRRGLRALPQHWLLAREIDRLSPRRNPPLSFLSRDTAVNKWLGKLTARCGL